MKYSIITPVYNAEKYLRECIESVINQTYSDWELILVDDGSTDASGTICDKYQGEDSRIKVVHSENQGGYKARLLGNKYISGDYVIGLDSDDMYEPDLLEKVECAVKKYNTDMIVFGRKDLDYTGQKKDGPFVYEKDYIYSKEEILSAIISSRDHALWDKAVKSDIYKTAKYVEEERRLVLDDDFLQVIPIVSNVETAIAIDDRVYIYRLDNESKSHNIKEENILDADRVNFRLLNYLEEEGLLSENLFVVLMQAYCKTIYPRLKKIVKDKGIFSFNKSKINNLDFMKIVYENADLLQLKEKERTLYKYITKGHLFWGVFLTKVHRR